MVRSEIKRRSKFAMAPKTWTPGSPAADVVDRKVVGAGKGVVVRGVSVESGGRRSR